jgi:hypothetical protein
METLEAKDEHLSRDKQREKVIDFLGRTHAAQGIKNILSDTTRSLDFDTFKKFLVRINGIARDIPIKGRSLDGNNIELKGFVDTVNVPRQEDKDELLKYAFESVSKIRPSDLKYVLPAVVNAVHAFAEANGRTSRVLHLLLREYATETERFSEMRKALGEDGRYDSFDINPGRISHDIEHVVMHRYGWQFNDKLEPERLGAIVSGVATVELQDLKADVPTEKIAKDFFRLYAEDTRYALTSIRMAVGDDGIERVSVQYGDTKRISPRLMVQNLSDDDWKHIFDSFCQLKKEHVRTIVDAFTEPEQYHVPDGGQTIRDHFINHIEKAQT